MWGPVRYKCGVGALAVISFTFRLLLYSDVFIWCSCYSSIDQDKTKVLLANIPQIIYTSLFDIMSGNTELTHIKLKLTLYTKNQINHY